jgi:hypothetical protein
VGCVNKDDCVEKQHKKEPAVWFHTVTTVHILLNRPENRTRNTTK